LVGLLALSVAAKATGPGLAGRPRDPTFRIAPHQVEAGRTRSKGVRLKKQSDRAETVVCGPVLGVLDIRWKVEN
jgi:hypothetical protein